MGQVKGLVMDIEDELYGIDNFAPVGYAQAA